MRRRAILNRIILSAFFIAFCFVGDGLAAARRATTSARGNAGQVTTTRGATSAKSNVASRGRAAIPTREVGGVASRAPAKNKAVAARAGVKQNVVAGGTKIAVATENTMVSESCAQKYNGCIDSFCMIENEVGGRCNCNNKIFEIDKILAEIEEMDLQSFQLATTGVETIETGVDISAITAKPKKKDKTHLDLWKSDTDGKGRGSSRFVSAHEVCVEKIPECESEIKMLGLAYSQQIKSDCVAYENSVNQKKKEAKQKIDAAHQAMRSAALTEIKESNKYDLGQCTIEFKKCMQTTGGCGDDFFILCSDECDGRNECHKINIKWCRGAISNQRRGYQY
ncbi:MAG: hypothetical protein IJY99_01880 [Alphaproteobacteria bacterium]|nr:hypothetical protein [Alphaproteobacteria bacterium]